jgi:predicted nucleic acid-binding protein
VALTNWLIDKSALVRLGSGPDARLWAERIGHGLVHVTTVTLLEVGFSAPSGSDLRDAARRPPLSLFPVEYLTPTLERRAIEVQMLLADQGRHRAPAISDLLVAATAELTGHTILHLNKDFELIAEITGQPTQRLETT